MALHSTKFRHRCDFRRRTVVDDGYGNEGGPFADLFSTYGDVRESTGKERVANGAVENARTATIRVMSTVGTRGLTEADQVETRNETWNIRSIANADARGEMLDILVEAGVAQ